MTAVANTATFIASAITAVKGSTARKPKQAKASKIAEVGQPPGSISSAMEAGSGGRDLLVPLDRLVLSQANVRRVCNEAGIAELAALIASQGLLQRLSVVAHTDGCFAVVAGGRRLRAMHQLVADGRWSASQPVECKLHDDARAAEVSLAENSGREAMHPADEMEAFRKLVEEGLTAAQVGGRFGVSVLTVERRLRLARLAPRFLAMYRNDEIAPDQLQALALAEDHAAQEAVWDGLSVYDRSAWRIRSVITAEACSADCRLARFVGLDTYEAEGGTVRRDLFSSPDELSGMFLDNPGLLQTLAVEKLRGHATAVKEEGWSWVECLLDADPSAWRGHGRERPCERAPTLEEAEAIAQLEAKQRAHAEAYDRHEDESDPDAEDFEAIGQQLCDALDAAEEQLMTARAALLQWTPEQLARAGAIVRLDPCGEVVIDRGLVRPGDRKATADQPAREDESLPGDDSSTARPAFSEKLMRDLTAHRTAALQAALVQNPHVALVALVHRMAETVFSLYGSGDAVVKVTVRTTGDGALAEEASGYGSSPAAAILGGAETEWGDRLPGSPAALFQWLLAQPQATLLELLAYCTARSVNAVKARARTFDHSDALAQALGLDMADWWVPTAANYLGRVSKSKAVEAVKEATGIDATKDVGGMKKAEAIAYCASKLEGTRWLPSPLRALLPSDRQGSNDD